MIGREGNQGNWFLWVAHGRELQGRRRVKSLGSFRGTKGQELDILSIIEIERKERMKEFFWILLKEPSEEKQ